MHYPKFLAAFFLLILVLGLTLKMKLFFGWEFDLVFSLLVVFGLIFDLPQTLFFAAFAAWTLNWRPMPGPELWVMTGVALVSYFGRYFMPWQRWVSLALLSVGGIFLLYAVASPALLAAYWPTILWDAIVSTLFGFATLRVFRFVFGK
jgi:hypothetical protein